MTHAAKSHDALEAAERLREELRRNEAAREEILERIRVADERAELDLLLADMASFLRQVPTRNFSDGQRLWCKGLADRVRKARSA